MSTWRIENAAESSDSTTPPFLASIGSHGKWRVLRSDSGLTATLLDRETVELESTLSIQFDVSLSRYTCVGVVEDFTGAEDAVEEDLCSLLKHCDLIAIPVGADERIPRGLEKCGRLNCTLQTSPVQTFMLLRNKPVEASLLTKDAPTGLGELDGNLEDREKWFKNRHSNRRSH